MSDLIEVGDDVAVIQYLSVDIGVFANLAVYDTGALRYAPMLSNTRIPAGAAEDSSEPPSSFSDSTSYLFGGTAESFSGSVQATREDGEVLETARRVHGGADAAPERVASG